MFVKEKETFIWINNDLVFKWVFSFKSILLDFVKAFLEYVGLNLEVADVIISSQKYVQNNNIALRDYYLDILIVLSNKQVINLEMYNVFGNIETKKSLSYAAMLYISQLKKGKSLSNTKKVISLNIIKGRYKDDDANVISKYELINQKTGKKLTEEGIEIYLAPLDKLKKVVYSKNEPRFIKWLRFIDCNNIDEVTNLAKGDDVFMSTKEIVEEFVRDPEMIKFFHNDNWKEESAELRGREEGREEGLELGREEGLELGRKEEKLETAKEMLKSNCDINFISKITKLSIPKIKTLL